MAKGDAATRWANSMGSLQTKSNYQDGVNAVTVSPTQLAADPAAEQRYLDGVQQSVQSGRRNQKLLSVSLGDWKAKASGKGAERLASGAQAAQGRVQAHFAKWGPIYTQISQACQALPKGGLQNAMARVQLAITMAKQAAGKAV